MYETIVCCRYTHIEGECPFIDFDGLLDRLEDLVADTVDRVMSGPFAQLVKDLNPVRWFSDLWGKKDLIFIKHIILKS